MWVLQILSVLPAQCHGDAGHKKNNKNHLHIPIVSDLKKEIKIQAARIDKRIKERADAYFRNNTRDADSLKELKELIKKYKGFIKVPFCSIEKDGEKCADILKAETAGGDISGTLYPREEKPKENQKCVVCNKKARHIVYVAKSY